MFREEMGDKPYLQIEVDEQYSAVGIITSVTEAFLNSISHRPPAQMPKDFNILDVKMKPANIKFKPDKDATPCTGPDFGLLTLGARKAIFEQCGYKKREKHCQTIPREVLMKGRAETNSKEYLPSPSDVRPDFDLVGRRHRKKSRRIYSSWIPFNEGCRWTVCKSPSGRYWTARDMTHVDGIAPIPGDTSSDRR
ncbi:MAG: hypothetical protein ACLSIT_00085 [Christensenellales bacterium]